MTDSELQISIEVPGQLVSLSGRLSARTVADVRSALTTAIEDGEGDLIVDIAQVDLVDASGLGVLVGAHRLALRSERRLVIRSAPQRVERLLAVTHLNRVLAIEPADLGDHQTCGV
ncbi:MAG TPA: STAS domain-containing protein [Mycobacteriales bacterium]|nr:STAS domain-containing protein [Mycobacteriales bacterium]